MNYSGKNLKFCYFNLIASNTHTHTQTRIYFFCHCQVFCTIYVLSTREHDWLSSSRLRLHMNFIVHFYYKRFRVENRFSSKAIIFVWQLFCLIIWLGVTKAASRCIVASYTFLYNKSLRFLYFHFRLRVN